jgi:hypothetical protein
MIAKEPAPDMMRGGDRASEKITLESKASAAVLTIRSAEP